MVLASKAVGALLSIFIMSFYGFSFSGIPYTGHYLGLFGSPSKADMERLEQTLKDKNNEIEFQSEKIDSLSNKIEELKEENISLTKELLTSNAKIAELEEARKALNKREEELNRRESNLNERESSLDKREEQIIDASENRGRAEQIIAEDKELQNNVNRISKQLDDERVRYEKSLENQSNKFDGERIRFENALSAERETSNKISQALNSMEQEYKEKTFETKLELQRLQQNMFGLLFIIFFLVIITIVLLIGTSNLQKNKERLEVQLNEKDKALLVMRSVIMVGSHPDIIEGEVQQPEDTPTDI